MKQSIIVDALSAMPGGGLVYLTEQVRALERVRPDFTLRVLVTPENAHYISKAIQSESIVIGHRNLASRLFYEQTAIAKRKPPADLLYYPGNFCSLLPSPQPLILTLQNAHYFGIGRLSKKPPLRGVIETRLANASARRADLVVVISNFLRTQLLADGFDETKLRLIPSGVPDFPKNSKPPPNMVDLSGFFLSVANDHHVKRLDDVVAGWVDAFRYSQDAPQLVLAGYVSNKRRLEQIRSLPNRLRSRILYLGPVHVRSQIKWLLENACAMITTSELESFGLTLVEAGAVGCPVIASDIPAHRETAGPTVRFFPVGSIAALSAEMQSTSQSPGTRVRSEWPYTWEMNAKMLGAVFDELV